MAHYMLGEKFVTPYCYMLYVTCCTVLIHTFNGLDVCTRQSRRGS